MEKRSINLGMMKSTFEDIDFVPESADFYIGSGLRLDIITTMVGLENITFDEALNHATIAEILDVQVPFLHIESAYNKQKSYRPAEGYYRRN